MPIGRLNVANIYKALHFLHFNNIKMFLRWINNLKNVFIIFHI